MKKVQATRWKVDTDDTGSLIDIDFTCPYCHSVTGDYFFCRDYVSDAFETDRECPVCGQELTIMCVNNN